MDFVEGTTLAARLAEPVPPTDDEARSFYTDIRSALAYCHSRGIVHGDLKAENVLLREDGSAVLSDFGISRITDVRMRQELELTGSCETVGFGTAYAIAPECRDGSVATTASDVYSFGVLMFKVVTGIWYDGSERLFANLKAFAPKWSALLESMLRRDPSRRPATAGDLPENPFDDVGGRNALMRGRYKRAALVAVATIAMCAGAVFVVGSPVGSSVPIDRTQPNGQSLDPLHVESGPVVMLRAGRRAVISGAVQIGRLSLPDDEVVSIEVPGDFSGTLLTAEEVDGELREQVRIVPQPGMRVLYRGNREVVIKRQ